MILKHQISATLSCFDLVRNTGSCNWLYIIHMTDGESSITAWVNLLLSCVKYVYYCIKFVISSEAVKTYHEENYKLLEASKIRGVNL